jgi:hypothetical protein
MLNVIAHSKMQVTNFLETRFESDFFGDVSDRIFFQSKYNPIKSDPKRRLKSPCPRKSDPKRREKKRPETFLNENF